MVAAGAAVAGLAEIGIVALPASYAEDADGLGGVTPWLPTLCFAAGAFAAWLWSALARDGAHALERPRDAYDLGSSGASGAGSLRPCAEKLAA